MGNPGSSYCNNQCQHASFWCWPQFQPCNSISWFVIWNFNRNSFTVIIWSYSSQLPKLMVNRHQSSWKISNNGSKWLSHREYSQLNCNPCIPLPMQRKMYMGWWMNSSTKSMMLSPKFCCCVQRLNAKRQKALHGHPFLPMLNTLLLLPSGIYLLYWIAGCKFNSWFKRAPSHWCQETSQRGLHCPTKSPKTCQTNKWLFSKRLSRTPCQY